MRIPTLLGLTILITTIIIIIMFSLYQQDLKDQSNINLSPQNIRYSNITDRSITVTWLSLKPALGSIAWGNTTTLGNLNLDPRDQQTATPRQTHFVTLENLEAKTNYFFKIRNGPFFYPDQPLTLSTNNEQPPNTLAPIIGRVLDNHQQPISDGLIFLEIPGAAPISTYVAAAGNFVLTLTDLRTDDLTNTFKLASQTEGLLLIQAAAQTSRVKIKIPTQKLPPIILGQDLDFRWLESSSSTK